MQMLSANMSLILIKSPGIFYKQQKTFKRFNQSENVSDNTDIKLEINNNDMVLYIENAKDVTRKLL